MKLQRYDFDLLGSIMAKDDYGEYVKHSEALDWFESIIGVRIEDYWDRQAQHGMLAERARLRALIAAERW